MKLTVGKRILLFVHWLLSLALTVLFLGGMLVPAIEQFRLKLIAMIPANYTMIAYIALAGLYLIFSICVLCITFKRGANRNNRGFIVMDSSDSGRVRISVSAVEQMARQAANTIDGLSDMKIAISDDDEALTINVDSSVITGTHIPTITMHLRNAIQTYVETNCGVAVKQVVISIKSVAEDNGGKKGKRNDKNRPAPQPVVIPSAPAPAPAPTYAPVEPEMPLKQPTLSMETETAPAYEQVEVASEDSYQEEPPEMQ